MMRGYQLCHCESQVYFEHQLRRHPSLPPASLLSSCSFVYPRNCKFSAHIWNPKGSFLWLSCQSALFLKWFFPKASCHFCENTYYYVFWDIVVSMVIITLVESARVLRTIENKCMYAGSAIVIITIVCFFQINSIWRDQMQKRF